MKQTFIFVVFCFVLFCFLLLLFCFACLFALLVCVLCFVCFLFFRYCFVYRFIIYFIIYFLQILENELDFGCNHLDIITSKLFFIYKNVTVHDTFFIVNIFCQYDIFIVNIFCQYDVFVAFSCNCHYYSYIKIWCHMIAHYKLCRLSFPSNQNHTATV